ncbi:ankyrin repeat domain-containing protein [Flavobacterium sp. F-65]|uniref:Ankyrin repeat domain-containing protein n=1 Tax=Flavobacterium pisciphilum TaxID=2893755 RepID=A0ABS8MQF7_9FLAO|nr:ankyrin repeat domain-containing protein [Flavobacterium sp. F-65]MCC9070466.1 ankyrin repeat domain-containing protein [Flavobacterium sp. F-65]
MKKSIVYLGIALVALVTNANASNTNFKSHINDKYIIQNYDRSPLNVAISQGDIEAVKKFIDYGADVNKILNGMTPLMAAARYNKVEIIKFLISKGASLDTKNERGYTALKYAEVSKAKDAVELLKSILKK